MALYFDIRYAIHIEFLLGYLALFVACLALISAYSSYTCCLRRPDDLGKDIGSLCFRICLSILPVHSNSGGPGGARVVDKDTATLSKISPNLSRCNSDTSNNLNYSQAKDAVFGWTIVLATENKVCYRTNSSRRGSTLEY